MLSEHDIETAIDEMATGLSVTWKLGGYKPSRTLSTMLSDHEIDKNFWVKVVDKIEIPELANHILRTKVNLTRNDSPFLVPAYIGLALGILVFLSAMAGAYDHLSGWQATLLIFSPFWLPMIPGFLDASWCKKNGFMKQ